MQHMGTKDSLNLRTPPGQLLDHPDCHAKAQQLLKGPVAGTGRQYKSAEVAQKVAGLVFAETTEAGGLHVETVLTTLGALAGFATQMAIREDFIKSGKISADKAFNVVTTKDGSIYYFGDLLNEGLVATGKGTYSVWTFVGGAAQQLGAKTLPDLKELFGHVSRSLGSKNFGVPRLPPQNMPHQLPFELLNKFWNAVRNYLAMSVSCPGHWPFVLGHATQLAIIRTTKMIDPGIAARVAMEAAVPMSKVDPRRVRNAYF
jgi:hypothetical protein